MVRYLTGGVLIRINRYTQEPVPSLAVSWQISDGGAKITFHLRHEVHFSNGSPFSAADVACRCGSADFLMLAPYLRRCLRRRNEPIRGIAETDEWRHYLG